MGFLRRLLGQPATQQPVAAYMLVPDRPDAALEIVGEQAYQPALEAAAGGRDESGPLKREHVAALVLEPNNRFDKNAICVQINGRRVGYLSREDAVRYGPVMRAAAVRDHVIACQAYMKGGWRRSRTDQGTIGVTLHLGSPGETLMDIIGEEIVVRQDHPWPGFMIAFTGDSRFQLAGVDLDRDWSVALARKAGMHVPPRMTKKVQLLVDCDTTAESGNQLKAIEYGVPVMSEADFWAALGLHVEPKQWRPVDRGRR